MRKLSVLFASSFLRLRLVRECEGGEYIEIVQFNETWGEMIVRCGSRGHAFSLENFIACEKEPRVSLT